MSSIRPSRLIVAAFLLVSSSLASAQLPPSPVPVVKEGHKFDVNGIVTDRVGVPIAGAKVEVFTGGRNYEPPRDFTKLAEGTTDEHGRFVVKDVVAHMEYPPLVVRATAPGMGYGYDTGPMVDMHTGSYRRFARVADVDEARIVLRPAVTIRGRVIDEDGVAVPGAEIRSAFPVDPVRTDGTGAFAIERCPPADDDLQDAGPSPRSLCVVHPGYVLDWFYGGQHTDEVVFKVRKGRLITGRVTDADSGAAISVATVTVLPADSKSPMGSTRIAYGYCDEAGKYAVRVPAEHDAVVVQPSAYPLVDRSIRYEPTDRSGRVELSDDRPAQADFTFRSKAVDPHPAKTPTTGPHARLFPNHERLSGLKGKVVDNQGHPVPLARVVVIDMVTRFETEPRDRRVARKSTFSRALSDTAGAFHCSNIDPREPLLLIARDATGERVGQIITEPGTGEVVLRLTQRGATLTGMMRDGENRPYTGVRIDLVAARDDQPNVTFNLGHAVSGADGRYEFRGFQAPPEGLHVWFRVYHGRWDWTDPDHEHFVERGSPYARFPVKPGETLDGLDYSVIDAAPKLVTATNDEYTRR